jgi:MscS family membrane protein
MQAIENIAISIGIFLVFLLFRKLFTSFLVNIVEKLTKRTKTTLDDDIIGIIKAPLRFAFMILGLYFAIRYLDLNGTITHNLFTTLAVYIVFWIFYDLIIVFDKPIQNFAKRFGNDLYQEIGIFIVKALKIIIVIIGIVAALQVWGINVSAFIASLGLGGLAFALAAKDTAANLFGGLTLLADKSLKMSDWIKVGSVEGVVEEIGLRTTKIRTFEKSLITVPNQILANQPVENFSRRGIRRIKFRVGVTYDTPSTVLEQIVSDITNMLKNHSDIAQDATMLVRFDKFEDSSLSIFVYTFTSTANWSRYLEIKEDVNIKIMKIIEQNNTEFAFPSQTLYLQQGTQDV